MNSSGKRVFSSYAKSSLATSFFVCFTGQLMSLQDRDTWGWWSLWRTVEAMWEYSPAYMSQENVSLDICFNQPYSQFPRPSVHIFKIKTLSRGGLGMRLVYSILHSKLSKVLLYMTLYDLFCTQSLGSCREWQPFWGSLSLSQRKTVTSRTVMMMMMMTSMVQLVAEVDSFMHNAFNFCWFL